MKRIIGWVIPCFLTSLHVDASEACSAVRAQEVVGCYVKAAQQEPLDHVLRARESDAGYEWRHYRMSSQTWQPAPVIKPARWRHSVEMHIPPGALPEKALLVVNNGVRFGPEQSPDYSREVLREISLLTRTVVVMITDVPNQALSFSDLDVPVKEDEAVAHTWAHWMSDEAAPAELPLHVPMAVAASRAMDLAVQELSDLRVERFIVTGASKRGWSAWLTALSDERVVAIVPAVIDVADTSSMLAGLRKRYGGEWPLALWRYQAAGVLPQLGTPAFDRLMQLMDPMQYLQEPGRRLDIPKYLVSASGDDFFSPDPVTNYLARLPGQTSLRVLPNSDHYGVRAHVATTLVPLVQRIQAGRDLPALQVAAAGEGGLVEVRASELPVAVRLWTAANPDDRDFRYACGVRFASQTLQVRNQAFSLQLPSVPSGWQAWFVEARFADGFVATSPVSVLPETFPAHPPKAVGEACKTFPG